MYLNEVGKQLGPEGVHLRARRPAPKEGVLDQRCISKPKLSWGGKASSPHFEKEGQRKIAKMARTPDLIDTHALDGHPCPYQKEKKIF